MSDPISVLSTATGKEAIKPVASIADALAGPLIARLRRWVADRDLAQRLESPELSTLFTNYERKLAGRVSALSTLVAREPLHLAVAYEPLTIWTPGSDKVIPEIEFRREGTRAFVIDGAGVGKSTFARHLILQALGANDLVPVLLNLRQVEDMTLIEAITRQFDDLDRYFDRELLLRLFSVGRFFFVFDGLDEVLTHRRPSLLAEIEDLALAAERSALVLTSRPETPLPLLPGAKTHTIQPLTLTQAKSLVHRYDNALGKLDIGERLIAEFPAVPARFLESPLLVALLYRTFGYNYSVSTKISLFYGELYEALYKGHDLTKTGYVRPKESQIDVLEFRRLLRSFAFLLTIKQRTSLSSDAEAQRFATDAMRLTSIVGKEPAAFISDLLTAVPLLVRDGAELRFIHKSIAEFFAAEYLVSGNPEGERLIREMSSGPFSHRFAAVFEFLADLDPQLFQNAVLAPVAEEAMFRALAEDNPIIRAAKFLGEAYIGFWPKDSDHGNRDSLPLEAAERMITIDLPGKDEVTVLVKLRNGLSAVVWRALSEPLGDQFVSREELGECPPELPMNTWLAVDDPRVVNAGKDGPFRATLAAVLSVMQPSSNTVHMPRILSPTKLQALSNSARADFEARKWLRKIVDGDDK